MRLDQPAVLAGAPPGVLAASATPGRRTAAPHTAAPARRTQPSRPAPSALDEQSSTVANLDPALLGALREAANAAARQGIRIEVTSGWRSAGRQSELLREAVAQYGSAAEAARWVATPERSEHVAGKAADLGPANAVTWLSGHGAAFGLCQVYRNEPWHFELRPAAVHHGCPALFADPTKDPRMQR
jgi:LAS superfamily LD-carboxypeptidase LdcB